MSNRKTLVIIPKTAFKPDSRNPLGEVFVRAGYDKVAEGDFDNRDTISQGDYEFLGIKGASALRYQISRTSSQNGLPVIMGDDILWEAENRQREQKGTTTPSQKILNMGIGPCRLRFLAPQENPIRSLEDIRGRTLFTKYPALLKSILAPFGISEKNIWEINGADTRVGEARDDGNLDTAAFEIVGSGRTARANRLDISSVLPDNFGEGNVSTNLSLQNLQGLSQYISDKIKDLGVALESALKANTRTLIKFNIPKEQVSQFVQYGAKGPTASDILTEGDTRWCALEISVENEKADRIFREIMEKGGKDVFRKKVPMGMSREDSEVLNTMSQLSFAASHSK